MTAGVEAPLEAAVHATSLSTEPSSSTMHSGDSIATPLRIGVHEALTFTLLPGTISSEKEGIGRNSIPTICTKNRLSLCKSSMYWEAYLSEPSWQLLIHSHRKWN